MSVDIYNPLEEDETEQSTIVDILYPAEPEPVFCQFDLDMDELKEFTNERISAEELSEDQRDGFKERVRRRIAREQLSAERVAAFQNMKFYKFYPVATPDTPDISGVKVRFLFLYTKICVLFYVYLVKPDIVVTFLYKNCNSVDLQANL
ncbi:putative protein HEAT INTOLERANT 4 [Helianthus annuus]|nr:putative protein HEAT INTOLERANT 4 [Helianthus annuus]KAJ0888068.1 putative protein HEAT INTOLERANT 4 [Helianthus annuus]